MKKLTALVLVLSMLFSLLAVPMGALAQELDNNFSISKLLEASSGDEPIIPPADDSGAIYSEGKVWFELNGNARLFVKSTDEAYTSRRTYTDYLPGVDFAGIVYGVNKDYTPIGDFATDQAGVAFPGNGGAMIPYTVDANVGTINAYSMPNFVTDTAGNAYWEIDGVKYLIRPEENVIKSLTQKIKTTSLTDADMIARYESLNKPSVIDVPDKKYESVGILTGAMVKYTKVVSVSLYYEGEEDPVVYEGTDMSMYDDAVENFTNGTLYLKNFTNSNVNSGGGHYFVPKTIQADSNKVLTKIEVKDSGKSMGAYPIYVLSAWGVEAVEVSPLVSLTEELAALNAAGVTSDAQYSAVLAKIAEIDAYIAETSEELTTEQKAVYDEAKVLVKAYEDLKDQESQITDLNQKTYTYVDLESMKNLDVFAPYADITNYARFNKSVSGASNYFGTTTIKYTPEGGEETEIEILDWLPPVTYEQENITGAEDFYKKGLQLEPTDIGKRLATYMYVADPLMSDVREATGYRYTASASSTAAMVYAGTLNRAQKTIAFTTDHIKERLVENGKKYAIIENYGVKHKVGPFASEFSPNAVYTTVTSNKTIPVNEEGTSLDVLMATANINTSGSSTSKLATGEVPQAIIQKFTVKYDDETTEVKYPIILNTAKTGDAKALERIIIYTEKKTDGSEWTTEDFYGDNKKTFKYLTAANQAEHKVDIASARPSDVVKFKNNQFIMQDTATVAPVVGARQDTNGTVHNDRASLISIPLEKGKKVAGLEFIRYYDYSASTMPESMIVAGGGTATTNPRVAVIPVTIEGANEAYDYFVYIGGGTGYAFMLGASVAGYSLNEKIEMLEERMLNVSTETECFEIDAEMAELIESTIVEKSDFDEEVLAIYEAKKKEFAGQAEEEERLESLKNRKYTYLEYPKDRDVFVTYQELVDFGRFNTAAVSTGSSTNRVTEKYTYAEGIELFRYLPHITSTGAPVTGQENYYFKGFQNSANNNLPAVGERGYAASSGYAYLSDTFFVPDGTELTGMRVSSSASTTSKHYYEGTVTRKEGKRTITAPSIVKPIDEEGYVIVKNGDVLSKVGPISQTEIKANAARFGNSKGTIISDVNTKGTSLDLLVTATSVNTAGGYTRKKTADDPTKNYLAVEADPTAALQEVVITYADGTVETKKVLITATATSSATDSAYRSLVFAPKYKDGEEIVYDEKSFYIDSENFDFKLVTKDNVTSIGVSSVKDINAKTVKFANENIIYSDVGHLANLVNNRQDTANLNYGDYTNYISVPLQNKEVKEVAFPYNINAALNESSAIRVTTEGDATDPSIALLPVTIEGASDDYVYFAYLGRVAADGYLMGATIMDISAQEKIDNAEKAMAAINENSTLADAKAAKELYERLLDESLINFEKDVDTELVNKFLATYEKVRENTALYADIDLKYYKGDAPKAKVTIHNAAELAGKPYTVIMAYYGEDDVMLDKEIKSGITTTEETVTLTFNKADFPAETKKVKVLVWKDFTTLVPLGEAKVAEETEKKIYMFVGDSITHSDEYRAHTEAFFMTRFPDKKAEFVNAGRSGGTANMALRRVEWDMKPNDASHAVIMFGMNDINLKTNYKPGANTTDAEKQASIDTCLTNLETLAGMLEENGTDITFMTPSIYDERPKYVADTNYVGANAALTIVGNGMKAIAAAKGYSIIDTNTVMNEVNKNFWDTTGMEMNIKDRIHPSPAGTYVIAYNVIKGLFPNSEVVAETFIDATAKTSSANNAAVEDVKFEGETITYNYTPKALPWAATGNYLKVDGKYLDLTGDLNREIIKVAGLEEGTYKIAFDGVEIGSFTNKELEAGVNIAILEKNPGQIQSQEVYTILNKKHLIQQKLRSVAKVEDVFRSKGIFGNARKIAEYIAASEAKGDDMTEYKTFDTDKALEAERRAEMEAYTQQARAKAIPTSHVVTISK